jgi:hypothetical protein
MDYFREARLSISIRSGRANPMPSCELSWGNENPLNCQCCICAWCRCILGLVGTHQCPCNLFRLRDARNSVAKWLEHPWCRTLLCRAKADLEIECSGSGLRVRIRSHSSLDSAAKKIIPAAAGRQAAKRRERDPDYAFLILETFSPICHRPKRPRMTPVGPLSVKGSGGQLSRLGHFG